MFENENLVTEVTENVENTTEQTQQVENPKTYTEDEVNRLVGKKKAATESRIRREYEKKFGGLVDVLRAGTGKETVEEIKESIGGFFQEKGFEVNKGSELSENDLNILARADAESIINLGADEVDEEVSRLEELGEEKLSNRERATLEFLKKHQAAADEKSRLMRLGVNESVLDDPDFKALRSKLTSEVSIEEAYKLYEQVHEKKNLQTVGSLRHGQGVDIGEKDFYSSEDIDRLTEEDLKDPNVWEKVRRSMTKGR